MDKATQKQNRRIADDDVSWSRAKIEMAKNTNNKVEKVEQLARDRVTIWWAKMELWIQTLTRPGGTDFWFFNQQISFKM